MKSINISNSNSEQATGVWYEEATGRLCVLFGSILRAIRFEAIPARDFDSRAEVARFSLGQRGSVVVCHHADGEETWFPVDMWWPGGFTPVAAVPRGRKKARAPKRAGALVAARMRAGLSQARAARAGGVPLRTLQEWEQGRQEPPTDRAEAYLESIVTVPARQGTPRTPNAQH